MIKIIKLHLKKFRQLKMFNIIPRTFHFDFILTEFLTPQQEIRFGVL